MYLSGHNYLKKVERFPRLAAVICRSEILWLRSQKSNKCNETETALYLLDLIRDTVAVLRHVTDAWRRSQLPSQPGNQQAGCHHRRNAPPISLLCPSLGPQTSRLLLVGEKPWVL